MAKTKRIVKPLATIWNCPDDLWLMIVSVLDELDPPFKGHRERINQRKALDGIIYQLRSGCQWNQLPEQFGDDSSVHRTMQRWIERGVFDRIWALLIESCQELDGVDWQWQSADGAMSKARFGGIMSDAIPRIAENLAQNAAY
jgi:putative transposase